MCNVAYGADADYGSLATMGMMGGAVREHAITLTGLTPNTTYHYRLNLTDEQARLYQSQDLTFTTGGGDTSAPGDRPEGENPSRTATTPGSRSNWHKPTM
jgi:phosphodiesterase/alkaline phosphatase D-like protein